MIKGGKSQSSGLVNGQIVRNSDSKSWADLHIRLANTVVADFDSTVIGSKFIRISLRLQLQRQLLSKTPHEFGDINPGRHAAKLHTAIKRYFLVSRRQAHRHQQKRGKEWVFTDP